MLLEMLEKRNLPDLISKDEMIEILLKEEYGCMPPKPEKIFFTVEENFISNFCAGKAACNKVIANCTFESGEFSFPFYVTLPTEGDKIPFFVHINFRPDVPDRYMPTEEIIDNGYAVLSFGYQDVTKDNGDFTDGLAGVLFKDGKRDLADCGKLAMWAWAAQRVMDYAQTLGDKLNLDKACVCGHSRLGKTALLTAMTDTRFSSAYSNNSGCSGAAISREKLGESVKQICERFPYWFCENYFKYADNESKMPFDQHYLLASIAPRKVLVGSATEDSWADPISEMLSCIAASKTFNNGFSFEDRIPTENDKFFGGDIGYHLRKGLHYFSREDWLRLIEFLK